MTFDLTSALAATVAVAVAEPAAHHRSRRASLPGLLGFASLLFLVIAGYFLARSMIKQFRKIDFDEDATELGIARPEAPEPEPSVEESPQVG